MNSKHRRSRDDGASVRCCAVSYDLFDMATGHSFAVLASHSVKQPINPKTGFAFTTYERKFKTETTHGNDNDERCEYANAPVRASVGSGAWKCIDYRPWQLLLSMLGALIQILPSVLYLT